MTARYRQIAEDLREDIEVGRYVPGAMLPGLADLTQRFRASRATVRQALGLLQDERLVRITHGRGTEVVDRRAVPIMLSRYAAALRSGELGPWELACRHAGVDGLMQMVDVEREAAPADIAAALQLDTGAPVIRRDRHALVEGQVVQLHSAWYPLAVVAGTALGQRAKVAGGVFAVLAAVGDPPATADETVDARAATAEEATELRLGLAAPVLTVERITRDAAGRPLELLRIVSNPARASFVYDGLPLG